MVADQVHSRRAADRVPEVLERLPGPGNAKPAADDLSRAFARTAGDEIQGLLTSPYDVVTSLETLCRVPTWRVGVGVGDVLLPVPDDVRAGTGEAYYAARQAISDSRTAAQRLAMRGGEGVDPRHVEDAAAAATLLLALWNRRTEAGWAVADLVREGLGTAQIAEHLGVTASAVSQRARAAGIEEGLAGELLAVRLLGRLVGVDE